MDRKCKSPQRPDSELKKYLIKIAVESSSAAQSKTDVKNKEPLKSKKNQPVKTKATKNITNITMPKKKIKFEKKPPIFVESEQSDSDYSSSVSSVEKVPSKKQKIEKMKKEPSNLQLNLPSATSEILKSTDAKAETEFRPTQTKQELPSSLSSSKVIPNACDIDRFPNNTTVNANINANINSPAGDYTSIIALMSGVMYDNIHNTWRAQENERRERELERREAELRTSTERADYQYRFMHFFKQMNTNFK